MGEDLPSCSMTDAEAKDVYDYTMKEKMRSYLAHFNAWKQAGI